MIINIVLPSLARKPGGGHKVIYEYSNRIVNDGHIVILYFFPGETLKKYHLPEQIRTLLLKRYGQISRPKWFHLDSRIKSRVITNADQIKPADIIIATGIETAYPVAGLAPYYGKKVYFIQDYENWHYSDNYVNSSYKLGMKNIVVSHWLKQIVDKYSQDQTILVSNGININIFKPENRKRREHSLVFHYRSTPAKGCSYALETVSLLHEEYDDLYVSIISSEPQSIDIPCYCHYYFNVTPNQVAEINNDSEVFICSTIDEGFGLPGLEAMACGCAVASTDYTGVHEYAVDGVNALLSPVRNSQAMADNVRRLFEDDKLRERIVTAGIETGKDKSVEKSYQGFRAALEEILSEG